MIFFNKAGITLIYIWSALFTTASYAQQSSIKPDFYTSLGFFHTSDNNIFRQASLTTSDNITMVSPELSYRKKFGKHEFFAKYTGEFASYEKNSTENYADNFVSVDFLFDFSKKLNVDLKTNYQQGHESRGASGVDSGLPTELTAWKKYDFLTGFTYGRKITKAQVEMDYSISNLAFTNNSQAFRDRESNAVSARIVYRVGQKTAVFIEGKLKEVDYVNSASRNLDSSETYAHFGLRWDASFKTSGELKIGTFQKDFDSAAETNGDGSSYEAKILWKPKSYSRFTLKFSKKPKETATADSFYTSSISSIDWIHDFNSSFALTMNVSNGIDKYSGTRKDKLLNSSLGLNYQFRRWLNFGLNYTNAKRDSTDNTADFEDDLLMVNATLTNL